MNITDLQEAQFKYNENLDRIIKRRKELHDLRLSFVKYFSVSRIRTMKIDDYVAGTEIPKNGFNFCYTIERQLDSLGRISGATAFKFGVYYGMTKSDKNYEYRFTKKFGNTYQEAFENVKNAILQLLKAGETEDSKTITENLLSPMFKGKILSTYFPERYLNVFSNYHLDHFLTWLDLDTKGLIEGDAIYKREALIDFKNQDQVMKKWSVDLFSNFLYEYPGPPPQRKSANNNSDDVLEGFRNPNFPPNPISDFIELEILTPKLKTSINQKNNSKSSRGNQNYEEEARKLKKLGDRGEKIVMDLEIKRLKNEGRTDLAVKVKRISLESDSYGFDILSFDNNGVERYIEVKATTSKVGSANFFYTINELQTALSNDNYYIYIVYNITSIRPKVWAIKNPFDPENPNIVKTPVNYRININVR